MKVDEGLLTFRGKEEVAVLVVIHEEVFGEDGGAAGMAKEVEGGFLVGVAVGVVGAEAHAGEVGLGGVVEAGGEGIGTGGTGSGVGAPAAGGEGSRESMAVDAVAATDTVSQRRGAMGVAGLAVWGGAQRRTKLTDEQVPLTLSTLASALPLEPSTIGPDHLRRPKRFRPLCPPVDGVDNGGQVDKGGQGFPFF